MSIPIVPVAAVALAVLLAFLGREGGGSGRAVKGARWAGRRELKALHGAKRQARGRRLLVGRRGCRAGRLALGYRGLRLLRAEARHALVVFGPPQSGKSAGLAIPALLEWDGPAVASSIKTDLLGTTLKHRAAIGEALVYDPFGLAAMPAHTWSPLHAATTWDGALEVAWRLSSAAEIDQRGSEGGDFWAVAAEQRLAPLLYAAAHSGGGIEQLVAWAYGQRTRTLDSTLEHLGAAAVCDFDHDDARAAFDAVQAFRAQADRTRTSIEATVQTLLRAYRFRRVAQSASGTEITAERLLRGKSTLYLIGDAKASKLLRPLFLALLSEVIDRAYELANVQGGRLNLPLLLCLDEAGNVAPLPNLAEVASTAPSHNIQLVSIFHDLAQARSRYHGQAETLVNSHRARMLLPGVADLDTLRYFSGLTGEQETTEFTRTTGKAGNSRSTAHRRTPLISPEALRQLPAGQALLIYGRIAPVRVRLRLWFRDRRLRKIGGEA